MYGMNSGAAYDKEGKVCGVVDDENVMWCEDCTFSGECKVKGN